jgi:glutathione peroxidase-family protein
VAADPKHFSTIMMLERHRTVLLFSTVVVFSCCCDAWTSLQSTSWTRTTNSNNRRYDLSTSSSSSSLLLGLSSDDKNDRPTPLLLDRRQLGTVVASTLIQLTPFVAANAVETDGTGGSGADDDGVAFADIAARAQRISQQVDAARPPSTSSMILATNKTAYDFTLPVAGDLVPFQVIIRQSSTSSATDESSTGGGNGDVPVYANMFRDGTIKAIIVVNIKQDDPVARKDIPELMTIATKYGGAVAIVACPTDQGYYEPDTSQLLRLKLASEYGYGINPSTVVIDKVNILGSAAHPFWRWLQSTCRTPAGLGRVQGNFEKFLVDGRTGLPVRRYPRKYRPLNMVNDIEALLVNKPLPPAGANYLEEWRTAATEAPTNTYRFEKGLNYFDGAT